MLEIIEKMEPKIISDYCRRILEMIAAMDKNNINQTSKAPEIASTALNAIRFINTPDWIIEHIRELSKRNAKNDN